MARNSVIQHRVADAVDTAQPIKKRSHKPPEIDVARSLRHSPFMWISDICVTLMVVVVLFWAYGSYWTNIESNKMQYAATQDLASAWGADRYKDKGMVTDVDNTVGDPWLDSVIDSAQEGDPLLRIFIPRLGNNWSYTVVKGVTDSSLAKGPGLYTSTQLPGERGNTGIAGHRDGRGAPFFYLDRMETCDSIVVESKGHWYTYKVLPPAISGDSKGDMNVRYEAARSCMTDDVAQRVAGLKKNVGVDGEQASTRGIGNSLKQYSDDAKGYAHVSGKHITSPTDNSVIAPMPSDKSMSNSDVDLNMLTLTTCNPLYFNYERLIIHAALVRIDPVTEGYVPAELEGVKV